MYKMRLNQKLPIAFFTILTYPFFHEKKATTPIDWKNVKNILVYNTVDILGDTIILLGFLRILKSNAPQAKITLCAKSFARDVYKNQSVYDEFFALSFDDSFLKKREVFKQLNETYYDVVINPRGDFRDIFFMYFLNSGRKISHTRTGGGYLLTDAIVPYYEKEYSHFLEDKAYLLENMGCKFSVEELFPRIFLTNNDKKFLKNYFYNLKIKNEFIVGIHPGASGPVKRWQYYGDLLKKIREQYKNVFFLIFGGSDEEEEIKKTISGLDDSCFKIIRENLENYIKIVGVCDCFLSNDSAAAHIAAAYGMPSIDIFTNNFPCMWKPANFKQKTVCIHRRLPCQLCYRTDKCKLGTYECRDSITAEEVFETFKKLVEDYGLENIEAKLLSFKRFEVCSI